MTSFGLARRILRELKILIHDADVQTYFHYENYTFVLDDDLKPFSIHWILIIAD